MRECLPCTACCEGWLKLNIKGESIYPGRPCSDGKTGEGCQIYEFRPLVPCQTFFCGWKQEENPLPDWFRPDNAKVIVEFNKLLWQAHPVDLAIPAGRRIPPRALNWLKQFSNRSQRPLLYMEQQAEGDFDSLQNVIAYGPAPFLEEIKMKIEKGERLWQ